MNNSTRKTSEVKERKPKEYTIYALMRPDTFAVFYVGMTHVPLRQRANHHISDAKYPQRWSTTARPTITKLIELELEPIVISLDRITTTNKRYVEDLERHWINHIWSTGQPIENKRGLHHDERPIYLDLIRRLHDAINEHKSYEDYIFAERVPQSRLIANWGMDD